MYAAFPKGYILLSFLKSVLKLCGTQEYNLNKNDYVASFIRLLYMDILYLHEKIMYICHVV